MKEVIMYGALYHIASLWWGFKFCDLSRPPSSFASALWRIWLVTYLYRWPMPKNKRKFLMIEIKDFLMRDNLCLFRACLSLNLCLFRMLLFRRSLKVMPSYADDCNAPLVVSLYRKSIDPSYQWIVWAHAESGFFDELFLEVLMDVIRHGRWTRRDIEFQSQIQL